MYDMKFAQFTIRPDTSFSLAAAAAFGFGPRTGRPKPAADEMGLAFVADDMYQHAGVHLAQQPGGAITVTIDTAADPDAVLSQGAASSRWTTRARGGPRSARATR